eukprot:TRINITY_DN6138_c0_g1_i1.p1 TRINITY_DN6138_c0_g1~~TRINITY_DN6138_c0_g1_i1.p1  ORF type:complete len:1095 (+),score=340.80 TRINITY_DN6138_c0_g1_i1:49-3285(+)
MDGEPHDVPTLLERIKYLEELERGYKLEIDSLKAQLRDVAMSPRSQLGSRKSSLVSQGSPKGITRRVSVAWEDRSPKADSLHLSVPRANSTSSFSGIEVSPRYMQSCELLQSCEDEIQKLQREIESHVERKEELGDEVDKTQKMLDSWRRQLENCQKAVTVEKKQRERMQRSLALQRETLANEEAQFQSEKDAMEKKRKIWQEKLKVMESEYKSCKASGMKDVDSITKELRALKLARHNSEALLVADNELVNGKADKSEIETAKLEAELDNLKKDLAAVQEQAGVNEAVIETYRSMTANASKHYTRDLTNAKQSCASAEKERKEILSDYEGLVVENKALAHELRTLRSRKNIDVLLLKEFRTNLKSKDNQIQALLNQIPFHDFKKKDKLAVQQTEIKRLEKEVEEQRTLSERYKKESEEHKQQSIEYEQQNAEKQKELTEQLLVVEGLKSDLEKQRAETEQEVSRLQGKLNAMSAEMDSLTKVKKEEDETHENIKSELLHQNNYLNTRMAVTELNAHERAALVEEVARLNKILSEMKTEKEGIIKEGADLRIVVKQLKAVLAENGERYDTCEADLAKMTKNTAAKKKELDILKAEIVKLQRDNKEMEDKLYWKTEDGEKLQQMIGLHQREAEKMTTECTERVKKEAAKAKELEDKLNKAQEDIVKMEEQIKQLEKNVEGTEEKLGEERESGSVLRAERDRLDEELRETLKVKDKKTETLDTTNKMLEEKQAKVSEAVKERNKLRETTSKLQQEINVKEESLKALEIAHAELKQTLEERNKLTQHDKQVTAEQVQDLQNAEKEREVTIAVLRGDKEAAEKKLQTAKEEIADLEGKIESQRESSRGNIKTVEERLEEARNEAVDLRNIVSAKDTKIAALRKEHLNAEEKLDEVREEAERLKIQVQSERRRSKEYTSVSRDIMELAEEKDRLKNEVTNLQKLHVRTLSEETQAFKNEVEEVKRQMSRSASPAASPGRYATPSSTRSTMSRRQEWDMKHLEFEDNVTLLKVQLEGLSDAMRRSTVAAHQLSDKWNTDEPTISPVLRPLDIVSSTAAGSPKPSSISPRRSISPPHRYVLYQKP